MAFHISLVHNYLNICEVPADIKIENVYPDKTKEMWLFHKTINVINYEKEQ